MDMDTWTATTLFQFSVAGSSIAAFGSLLLSPEPLTARRCLGTLFFHGPVGGSISMVLYEAGFKQWRSLAVGILYAAGIVHIDMLRKILLRALEGGGTDGGGNGKGNSDGA